MSVFIFNGVLISTMAEAMIRAQARTKKAQEQAEAANRAKSIFLSTMSHEFRTPLNAILGFSNLMQGDIDIPEKQRKNLNIINRSGKHLLGLINDVLDMAKIEAGQNVVEIKPFDLGALVRDITDMLTARAVEKGLELRLDQTSEFPRFIKGDEGKLRQIIINLVGNAIKYTDQGTVTLRLGVWPDSAVLRLIIEVEDTGVGISEEDQLRIFDPFVQVGKSGTHKGTGLGLAIVREHLKLLGGDITIKSALNKGSLFRVNVPVQRVDQDEVVPADALQGQVVGLESGQPDYRILIVEDQEENWLLLQRLLEGAGFTVKVAKNGLEGVELFQTFHPHFIWMDRRMPVMDGIEATQRIRALDGGKEVKIAAVTASAFSDQRREILEAGMDDFVRKPYQPAEIFDCLAKQLGVHYVYAHAAPAGKATVLSLDLLAKLPATIRRELLDGMVLGNVERLDQIMLRIEQQDAEIAKLLTPHLASYNYLPVIKALEITEKHLNGTES